MNDPVVLSYGDALLRSSDLQILQSDTGWLNDRIIGYVFEFLERETFAHLKPQLSLVTPDVAQFIKLSTARRNAFSCLLLRPSWDWMALPLFTPFVGPDGSSYHYGGRFLHLGEELAAVLEPLCLQEKELVLLAVNNSFSVTTAGGSHWSLLAYIRSEDTFKHFDSLRGSNVPSAQQCAVKLGPLVKCGDSRVVSVECPQQSNGYDCGVYLVCFAEQVVQQVLLKDTRTLEQTVSTTVVKQWRQKTLNSIQHQQKQK